MAKQYILEMKKEAINMYLQEELEEKAIALSKKDNYSPIFPGLELHAESESTNRDINIALKEVSYDVSTINIEIANAAYSYNNLLLNTKNRLFKIEEDLNVLINKRKDIEMFDCTDAITLTESDFEGSFSLINNCFCAKIVSEQNDPYNILDVSGNGYEGNKHVIANKGFLEDTIKTDNRDYISDNSKITVYEYSRINADSNEVEIFPLLNKGYVPAKCCLTLQAKNTINTIKIVAINNLVQIDRIEISDDGINFKNTLDKAININKSNNDYIEKDYIEGSGIVSFPSSKYVKIYLQSTNSNDDMIGYKSIQLNENNNIDAWANIDQKIDVKINQKWKIDLKKEIQSSDIYSSTIESDTHNIMTSNVLSEDKRSILVSPKENYITKKTYTLKFILNNKKHTKIVFNAKGEV